MIDILHRDEFLIVVSKPAGRIVVPGRAGAAAAERSLRDEVADQIGARVFVVHRLDRGTSGALAFALSADAHRALSLAFERHQVDKRYWALCRGTLVGGGEVDLPLFPVRGGRMRAARPGEGGGKPSRTSWRALERLGPFTAVEFRPRTGRLHQIRVHAAALGHPLAVDPGYGGAAALRARDLHPTGDDALVVDRLTLHAASLRLSHPLTGAPLEIEAPLPPDLTAAVALLRRRPVGE
ncbi:MAG TPA: RluA family pseudouridine synthase [Polyangia bacterium]|nr:RluA family pseudouridine synthase [Polyangia bacterium]